MYWLNTHTYSLMNSKYYMYKFNFYKLHVLSEANTRHTQDWLLGHATKIKVLTFVVLFGFGLGCSSLREAAIALDQPG